MGKWLALAGSIVTGVATLGLASSLPTMFFAVILTVWAMLWSVGAGLLFWYLQAREQSG